MIHELGSFGATIIILVIIGAILWRLWVRDKLKPDSGTFKYFYTMNTLLLHVWHEYPDVARGILHGLLMPTPGDVPTTGLGEWARQMNDEGKSWSPAVKDYAFKHVDHLGEMMDRHIPREIAKLRRSFEQHQRRVQDASGLPPMNGQTPLPA